MIMDILGNQMEEITGGKLIIETEIDEAADKITDIIIQKRRGLGLNG